jgi:hypothetical protein
MIRVIDHPVLRAVAVPIALLVLWQLAVMITMPGGRTPVPSKILVTAWRLGHCMAAYRIR